MWTEADIRFFISVADKAGAYSWMAKKTCSMFTNRLFWLHLFGILIVTAASAWSIVTGIFSNAEVLQQITLIISGVVGCFGVTLNNFDKLLNYVELIKQYASLQESAQLLYWTIYPALQNVGQVDEMNVNTLKEIVDAKQKEIIKKYKEFPKSVIQDYYATFKDAAVDYNVLFNDKIDPTLLIQKMSMASINNSDVIVNMAPADNIIDQDAKDVNGNPVIVPLNNSDHTEESDETSPRPPPSRDEASVGFLHGPRFRHMATIKPMTEETKNKRTKLTKLQQYELDKYLLNFE